VWVSAPVWESAPVLVWVLEMAWGPELVLELVPVWALGLVPVWALGLVRASVRPDCWCFHHLRMRRSTRLHLRTNKTGQFSTTTPSQIEPHALQVALRGGIASRTSTQCFGEKTLRRTRRRAHP